MNLKHPNRPTTKKSIPHGKVVAGTTGRVKAKKMGSGPHVSKAQSGKSFNGRAYERTRKAVFGLPKSEDQGKA